MAESIKTPLNKTPGTIGDLVLDCLLQEEEKLSNTVTKFPVESGSSSNDHIIIEPDILTITGFVTNSPIWAHAGTVDGKARVTKKGEDQLVGTDINFADLALTYLREIRKSKKIVTVTTKRGTWDNMVVEEISRIKNKDTGDALAFVIRLTQFQTVKLFFVDAPRKRTKSSRAQPRAKVGKKSTTPDDDYASTAYRAEPGAIKVVSKLADFVKGFIP